MQKALKKKFWLPVVVAVAVVLVLAVLFIPRTGEESVPLDEVEVTDTTDVEEITLKYGIPIDRYDVHYGIIEPGQNLSYLLARHGMSALQVHKLNKRSEGIFDVRRVKAGQAYATFHTRDSVGTRTEYLVYEESPRSYVVFDLRGDFNVYRGQYPVTWKEKSLKGVLNSSLWVAIQEQGASPLLSLEMSNIFGWSIDFFGLQEGDEFRLIYSQEYVEDQALDSFHVLAASFRHADSTYYAIPFTQDGEELYYNEHGNSLEGAFLKAPLDYYRITSRFSLFAP